MAEKKKTFCTISCPSNIYCEQPALTFASLKSIILMNVIRTDGAQPGCRSNSELQSILRQRCCDYSLEDTYHAILTIRRSVVQNPFGEHQGSHVSKQQDKEEQLWQKFKEQVGIPLEIPKKLQ